MRRDPRSSTQWLAVITGAALVVGAVVSAPRLVRAVPLLLGAVVGSSILAMAGEEFHDRASHWLAQPGNARLPRRKAGAPQARRGVGSERDGEVGVTPSQ